MLEFYDVTLSQNTLHLFLYHRNNAVSFHLIHLRPGGQENAQRILSYPLFTMLLNNLVNIDQILFIRGVLRAPAKVCGQPHHKQHKNLPLMVGC